MAKKPLPPPPRPPHGTLRRALDLIDEGRVDDAEALLTQFVRSHPTNVEALQMLAGIYQDNLNLVGLWDVSRQLLALEPDDPVNVFNFAVASIANHLPFSALHYAETYLARWPDGEEAADMRQMAAQVAPVCAEIRVSESLAEGVQPEDLMNFEQAQLLLSAGRAKEAREQALRAAEKLPHVPAPLNNLSLAYAVEGKLDDAIAAAQQVLARFPGNEHASSNLVQFLVRAGRRAEAEQAAAQVRDRDFGDNTSGWMKAAEGLAYLGDDRAVVALYERCKQNREIEPDLPAFTLHVAAVSYARLGDEKQARKLWQAALKRDSTFDIAQDNLDDLKLPVGERNGPWPFAFQQWVSQASIQALYDVTMRGGSRDSMKRRVERLLREMPQISAVVPILLERGDPPGRELALIIAIYGGLPVLREYAMSKDGPDESRVRAANEAVDCGLLARGQPVLMYSRGQQQELLPLSYEIYDKPQRRKIPRRAQQLLEESHTLLSEGRYQQGLDRALEALQLAPNDPSLLNFQATALQALGRTREAEEVIRRTVELHPDYLFGLTALAELHAEEKRFEEAHALLRPLMQRSRFHVSEFAALCKALIEVFLAEGQREGARSWLAMWEDLLPDHPGIAVYRRRVGRR